MFSKHLTKILAALPLVVLLQSCEKNSTDTPDTGSAPQIKIAQDSNTVLYHIGNSAGVQFEVNTSDQDGDLLKQQVWFNDSCLGQTSYDKLEFVVNNALFQNGKQRLKIVATDAGGNATTVVNNYVCSDLLIWKQNYHRMYFHYNVKVAEFSDGSSFMSDGSGDSVVVCSPDGSIMTGYDIEYYGRLIDKLSDDRVVTLSGDKLNVYDKQFNQLQSHNLEPFFTDFWPMGLISLKNDNILTYGGYESDLVLRCYSLNGSLLWQKIYGGDLVESQFAVDESADGSIYVSCQSNSGGHGSTDILVYKLTGQGDIIWQQYFGGNGYETNYSIHADQDGGCLLGTYSQSHDLANSHWDGWLIKLDKNGNKLWDKASPDFGLPLMIDQYTNGNYLIINRDILNGDGGSKITLVSPDGEVLNKVILNEGIRDAQINSNDKLLLFYAPNYTYYDNFMKLDLIK